MTLEEKRRAKHPDTEYFHYYNANPKNKVTSDCVIRAVCTVLGKPYEEVVVEMAQLQAKTGHDCRCNMGISKYMEMQGWTKLKQPRKDDNTKYTGKEFCQTLLHPIYSEELNLPDCEMNRVLANIGGHHIVAIMSGQIWDIWNSTEGSIGNIWVKLA